MSGEGRLYTEAEVVEQCVGVTQVFLWAIQEYGLSELDALLIHKLATDFMIDNMEIDNVPDTIEGLE